MERILELEPVMAQITENLDPASQLSLMLTNKRILSAAAAQVYRAPSLHVADSFETLMDLINLPLPYLSYASFIRELSFTTTAAADNIYMGDLDYCLALCKSLELFKLENCYHISNILIQALAQSECRSSLLHIAIRGCPISDRFIPLLAKQCKVLERLDLAETNVSILSLHSILSKSTALISLDLSECSDAKLGDIQGIY